MGQATVKLYADFRLCRGHHPCPCIVQGSTVYNYVHTHIDTNIYIYVSCVYKYTQIYIYNIFMYLQVDMNNF